MIGNNILSERVALDGLIPINKAEKITSKDVSRELQRLYGRLKLGHVGTLDPMAAGVLPILVGKATRLQDYLLKSRKVYELGIEFGYQTDTLDNTGRKTGSADLPLSDIDFDTVLTSMRGLQTQVPPIYSAVKYKGRPLYWYAREGKSDLVPLSDLTRVVEIYSVSLVSKNLRNKCLLGAKLRISASKGTYMRVLAQEIAKRMGTLGTMVSLTRIETAGIEISKCVSIDDLSRNPTNLNDVIVPIVDMPLNMTMLCVDEFSKRSLEHGCRPNILFDHITKNIVKLETNRKVGELLKGDQVVMIVDENHLPLCLGKLIVSRERPDLVQIIKVRGL